MGGGAPLSRLMYASGSCSVWDGLVKTETPAAAASRQMSRSRLKQGDKGWGELGASRGREASMQNA